MKTLFDAVEMRDSALHRVASNSGAWMPRALEALRQLKHSGASFGEFTGEELRGWMLKHIEPPHHHNAWGAFIKIATKEHLIQPTGRMKNMRGPKSHARSTPVYSWGQL